MKLVTRTIFCIAFSLSAIPAFSQTIEMHVNGLVCAFCAQGIEKKLRAFPQTTDVFVSLENHLVVVALGAGTDITDTELKKAITDAGYNVTDIERTERPLSTVREQVHANGH